MRRYKLEWTCNKVAEGDYKFVQATSLYKLVLSCSKVIRGCYKLVQACIIYY